MFKMWGCGEAHTSEVTSLPLAFLCWVRWRGASDSREGWAASVPIGLVSQGVVTVCFLFNPVLGCHMPSGKDYGDTPFMSVKTSILTLYYTASCTPKQATVLCLECPWCGPSGLLPLWDFSQRLSTAVVSTFRRIWGRSLLYSPVKKSLESHLYLNIYAKQNGGWGAGSALKSTGRPCRGAWIPASTWWFRLCITLVLRDDMLSSDFSGHLVHMWCTHIHIGKHSHAHKR